MTAFNLRLPEAVFPTSLRGLRLPDRHKLVGEYVLGVSEAESVKNRADPSRPLTVQGGGSIGYAATYATVKSDLTTGYGFLTGMVPNDDATLICIRERPTNVGSIQALVGMAAPAWVGFFQNAGTQYAHNGEPANNQGANRPVPTGVQFEALVMSRENVQRAIGGYGKLYYYAAGVQTIVTSAQKNVTGRTNFVGRQIAIGSNVLTNTIPGGDSFKAYFFALYQRPLSAAEIDEAYLSLKADYATRGVTVV